VRTLTVNILPDKRLSSNAVDMNTPSVSGDHRNDLNDFDEESDELETIGLLFHEIDGNHAVSIDRPKLESALSNYKKKNQKEMAQLMEYLICKVGDQQLSLQQFTDMISDFPHVKGQRVAWAKTLNLAGELARHLKPGDLFDGLRSLREMEHTELEEHIRCVCAEFSSHLPALISTRLLQLKAQGVSNAEQFKNSKFSMEGAFEGNFATVEEFHLGPEKLIGNPNPLVEVGMKREHCSRPNARRDFTTTNYNVTTHPALEWDFVVEASDDPFKYPHTPGDKTRWRHSHWNGEHGRDVVRLDHFLSKTEAKTAQLMKGEVIALRLYTGPMFVLYNAGNAYLPQTINALIDDRRFPHSCSSPKVSARCTCRPARQ
jgi:hypothetical protein